MTPSLFASSVAPLHLSAAFVSKSPLIPSHTLPSSLFPHNVEYFFMPQHRHLHRPPARAPARLRKWIFISKLFLRSAFAELLLWCVKLLLPWEVVWNHFTRRFTNAITRGYLFMGEKFFESCLFPRLIQAILYTKNYTTKYNFALIQNRQMYRLLLCRPTPARRIDHEPRLLCGRCEKLLIWLVLRAFRLCDRIWALITARMGYGFSWLLLGGRQYWATKYYAHIS